MLLILQFSSFVFTRLRGFLLTIILGFFLFNIFYKTEKIFTNKKRSVFLFHYFLKKRFFQMSTIHLLLILLRLIFYWYIQLFNILNKFCIFTKNSFNIPSTNLHNHSISIFCFTIIAIML